MMILIQAKSYRKCKTNRLESRSKAQTIPDQDQLSLRTRLARATQWVYLSAVKGKEFSEMKIIRKAEVDDHITVQHIFDIKKIEPQTGQDKNIEDEFSVL